MKKLVIFLFFGVLIANEANKSENLQNLENNKSVEYKQFSNLVFEMPNDAFVISIVNIDYIDKLGNKKTKILEINASVNYENDFILMSRKKPQKSNVLDVSVTSSGEKLAKKPGEFVNISLDFPIETLKFDNELRFFIKEGMLKISTNDKLKSAKSLKNGTFKLEFYRNVALSSVEYLVNKGGFEFINVTRNDGFYTIIVKFNGGKLELENEEGGVVLKNQKTTN